MRLPLPRFYLYRRMCLGGISVLLGGLVASGCEGESRPKASPAAPEVAGPSAPTETVSSSPSLPSDAPPRDPETDRMVARIEAYRRAFDPRTNAFLNRRRADLFAEELAVARAPAEVFDWRTRLGLEELRAGATSDAIATLRSALEVLDALPAADRSPNRWLIEQFLGVAHLRLAEESNCVAHQTAHSCVFPIEAAGRHGDPAGARGAIAHFMRALEENERDLASVWLLNIAHMALGSYPGEVPAKWVLPQRSFAPEGDAPRFREIARASGCDVLGLSGGVVFDDLDGDGSLDILASSWGCGDPLRYLVQDSEGRFTDRTREAGLEGITGGLNLAHADLDNDGDLDVLVLRGAWMGREGRQANSYLENAGGRFVDRTESAGLLSERPTQTAAFADFDLDGRLDVFVGNECEGEARDASELFHQRGDGTFVDRALELGVADRGFVKGVAWGDIDDDGDPDLYLSRLGETNRLLRNDRDRFVDITEEAGVAEPLNSFATWFFDEDEDGDLDLFVASYEWEATTERVAADFLGVPFSDPDRPVLPEGVPRLYRNEGGGRFRDVTRERGLVRFLVVMGAGFGDIDNDGRFDLYLGTGEPSLAALMPNRLLRRDARGRYLDVTTAAGLGHLQKGHGIAFADFDRDGDQDIYCVLGGAYEADVFRNALFANPLCDRGTPSAAHWITLTFEGTRSNRSAIGAKVSVELLDGNHRRTLRRDVGPQGSFGSTTLGLHIGLANAKRGERLTVRWPAGGVESIEALAADDAYHVKEGTGRAQRLPRKPTPGKPSPKR